MTVNRLLTILWVFIFPVIVSFAEKGIKDGKFSFSKEKHDFGEVKEGKIVSTSFKFKNVGDSPIIINKILSPCGCTTPLFPKTPILPGKTGIIKVQFDTKGKSGRQVKSLKILSNIEEQNHVTIVANVI